MTDTYDLIVIGAGSGGLTAAGFAAKLGARTALVERARVGGDCTWTGCVPSKALIRVARAAHEARTAAQFGIQTGPPTVDMAAVRAYVQGVVAQIAAQETPAVLRDAGLTVIEAEARFLDATTIQAGAARLTAKTSSSVPGRGLLCRRSRGWPTYRISPTKPCSITTACRITCWSSVAGRWAWKWPRHTCAWAHG